MDSKYKIYGFDYGGVAFFGAPFALKLTKLWQIQNFRN
jgi:hypothetical protein